MKESLQPTPKVVIIGDSMALPRGEVRYEDTWPRRLKDTWKEWDWIALSRRGMTSNVLVSEGADEGPFPPGSDFLEFYQPDVIILQLGLVDCYPRHFRQKGLEQRLLSYLPQPIRSLYIQLVKKIRGVSKRFAYVRPSQFRTNLQKYVERCDKIGVKIIFLLAIAPVSETKAASSELVKQQIDLYNRILAYFSDNTETVQYIDPFPERSVLADQVLADGYHLSAKGHEAVFEFIKDRLKSQIS